MGIEWPDWALTALRDIEPYEVMRALQAERRWPRAMVGLGGLAVVAIWARTQALRLLMVVLRPMGGLDWQIIGARDLRPGELEEFEQWEASGND